MHRQIGNAVPWQVGLAIGKSIRDALYKEWIVEDERGNAMDED